ALWQRKYLDGEVLERKLAYWQQKLRNIMPLQLPTDHARPSVQSTRGSVVQMDISKELTDALKKLSNQQGATLYMTLLAAYKVLLYRYSNQEDICVGSATAGRQQREVENIVGFFLNAIALRSNLSNDPGFLQLLEQIKATTLEAYEHLDAPFEKVVEVVVKERDMSRSPIFQVMFSLQNNPDMPVLKLGDIVLEHETPDHITAKFDLIFFMAEHPGGLRLTMEYCTDLFNEDTIKQMGRNYVQLLQSVVQDPNQHIRTINILSEEERRRLLVDFNDTAADYSKNKTVIDLLEAQVYKTPEAVAVACGDNVLTYAQLNERSNQVAHYLMQRGVQAGSLIALCTARNIEMVVGIMGILKAGAAYVPIDPSYPAERIRYMLKDSGAAMVLTSSGCLSELASGHHLIDLNAQWQEISALPKSTPAVVPGPHSLIYVIYTSGSTGQPKAAGVYHAGVMNLVNWYVNEFAIGPDDGNMIISSIGFDLTQKNIFATLAAGAAISLPCMDHYDTRAIMECIAQNNVTIINCAPSAFYQVVEEVSSYDKLLSVRLLVLGGEPISLQRFMPWITATNYRTEIVNSYGPTECTDIASFYRLKEPAAFLHRSMPIGKPNFNVQLLVLNELQQLQPIGVIGELYIAGDGVGAGYINDAVLTSGKFFANKFGAGKMYRTGDLCRWLSDGNLEYLGRADHQVKVRGYRVELGEIESAMNSLEAVNTSCVVAKHDKLVGYYVPDLDVVKEKETELYLKQVEGWKDLYETAYSEHAAPDAEFDLAGWNDSFTGKPIAADLMRQWLEDIATVILSEPAGHVLEIGCGTGLIYYRIADHIKKYTGSDPSRVSVESICQRINEGAKQYPETNLSVCAAHEVKLPRGEYAD
ncbi:MAG TPA: amino acid adenylation domain-containing protein, partial [Chitinophagaceae bacterium]|nr:amino acid adenylation domain-containing protein [Chitinophagaceae bacterium]